MKSQATLYLVLSVLIAHGSTHAAPDECAIRLRAVDADSGKKKIATAVYCQLADSDNRFLVTAYHAVYKSASLELVFDKEGSLRDPIWDYVERRFVCMREGDLAVFRLTDQGRKLLEEKRGRRPVTIDPQHAPLGARVLTVGNPTITFFKGDILEHEANPLNYVAEGTVSNVDQLKVILGDKASAPEAQDIELILLGSRQVVEGFSGGPVIISDNGPPRLIGMIQGGDPTDPDRSWAIPSHIIRDTVQQFENAIDYPPDPWPTPFVNNEYFSFARTDIRLDILLSQTELGNPTSTIAPSKWLIESEARLSKDGLLVTSSKAWIEDFMQEDDEGHPQKVKTNFRGTIGVVLFDQNKNYVWGTRLTHQLAVSENDPIKTGSWTEQVPIDKLPAVAHMFIWHNYDSTDMRVRLRRETAKQTLLMVLAVAKKQGNLDPGLEDLVDRGCDFLSQSLNPKLYAFILQKYALEGR
jgi:hypothetical protein